jgi:hypothetical protein
MNDVGSSTVIRGFEYNTAEKRITPVMRPRFREDFSSRKTSGGTSSAAKCDPRTTSTAFKDDHKDNVAVKFSKLQQENEALRELLTNLGSLGEAEKAGALLSSRILLGKDDMDWMVKKDWEESEDEDESK